MSALGQKSRFKPLGHLDVSLFTEASGWQQSQDWCCFLSNVFKVGLAITSSNSGGFDFFSRSSFIPIDTNRMW